MTSSINDLASETGEGAPVRSEAVIVGGGPAGLAVAACLRRAQIPFVVVERGDQIAMSWHWHYERLHLHTSKAFSGLPYFPFPRHYPRYPSRLQVIAYLEAYAEHFGIRPTFGQNVVAVTQAQGEWRTVTEGATYVSPNLVIATGYNRRPHRPTWPGQAEFEGPIVHSSEYRTGEPYRGKSVLVVGFGNSGGEIAIDLWEHGARSVVLAVRGAVNIIPRDLFGIPSEAIAIAERVLPPRIADALNAPILRMRLGDLKRYGLSKASDGPIVQISKRRRIPLIDVGTVRLIQAGEVIVRPGVSAFTSNGVIFADGSTEAFDAVILATGYRSAIDEFLPEAASITDEQGVPTANDYEAGLAGLYFCGFTVAPTGVLREIGIEAKRIAEAISRHTATREGR